LTSAEREALVVKDPNDKKWAYDYEDALELEAKGYSKKTSKDDEKKVIVLRGYATGGYTGAWGPEGRLAMLHQKELVLNADDTKNFLAATDILRNISQFIDLQAASNAFSSRVTSTTLTNSTGALE
jgi:hypothetical protein